MGAGLGAAGLASGLAASHFERVWGLGVVLGVGRGGVKKDARRAVAGVGAAWRVETMDCLVVLGGGAVL